MKASHFAVAVACCVATQPAFAESYFCKADMATGFKWSPIEKRWKSVDFTTDDAQFLLSSDPSNPDNYRAQTMGETSTRHRCQRKRSNGVQSPQMVCGGLGYGLIVNFNSLRFQEVYTIGYVDGEDRPGNDPSLTAGRCVKVTE